MNLHPKIKKFIDLLKWAGINEYEIRNRDALNILKQKGATSTEAMVVLHQGFNLTDIEAENVIKESKLFETEDINDVAYQTFLYMNYNPDDPDFYYDENKVRIPLIPPKKDSQDADEKE